MDITLSAWIDSDHVTYPDTRRSVSEATAMFGWGAITWVSWAQRVTAATTPDSEYIALAELVHELVVLRQMRHI